MQEEEQAEDGEAERTAEWDRAAADAAYRAEVERAQREQKLLEERLAQVTALAYLPAPSLPSIASCSLLLKGGNRHTVWPPR